MALASFRNRGERDAVEHASSSRPIADRKDLPSAVEIKYW
jgi:hypothetical protein